MTNTSTLIIQLEPSSTKEILLESKIPTDVSLLSGTGVSVTSEIWVPRKKGILNHHQYRLQERVQVQTNIVP